MSTPIIALILPTAIAIVALTFIILSRRFDMPAALAWGLGLLLCGAGFTTSVLLSPHLAALTSDFLFVSGFSFFAEAFLRHFSLPIYRRERLAFAAIYLIMNFYVVLGIESLKIELLLNDIATSCLLGFALLRVMNHATSLADRAVVLTGSVVVIDTLLRVLIFVFFVDSSDRLEDFGNSSYAQAMQVTTSVIGVIYVLSIGCALGDRLLRTLRDAAERDPLSNLLNRRGFEQAMADAARHGNVSGAVIICDIDHFKRVNDQFGHTAGDRVIETLARTLEQFLPKTAISARFGGEEFVSFVPNATLAEAGILAQGLRARFAAQDWRFADIDQQITASFGVAVIAEGEDSVRAATDRADRALYDAKAAGRNKVIWDGGNYESGSVIVDIQQILKGEARRSADGT